MSVYITIGESGPLFAASNTGWANFVRWVESQDLPNAAHLTHHGWDEPASALHEELACAETPDDADVADTLATLIDLLNGETDEPVVVTDGTTADGDDTAPTFEQWLAEVKDASGHEHADDGKFGSGGGSAKGDDKKPAAGHDDKADDKQGWSAKIGAAVGKAEHAAKHLIGKGVEKLPPKMQTAVKGAYKLSMLSFNAGHAAAVGAAKGRGLPEAHVARLGQILSIGDVVGMKALPAAASAVGLGGAAAAGSSFIPLASTAYLGYSLARNPVATMKAAGSAIKDTIAKLREQIEQAPADRMAATLATLDERGRDWYYALVSAALDETGSMTQAVELAEAALAASPDHPDPE